MIQRCQTCQQERGSLHGGHTCDDCISTGVDCGCTERNAAFTTGKCQEAARIDFDRKKQAVDSQETLEASCPLRLLPKAKPSFTAYLGCFWFKPEAASAL